eukprot:m.56253 g.56253  ORF g.56253 m.56253 type:complete len:455 (-) comp11027_c0_seq1:69-1433(-)
MALIAFRVLVLMALSQEEGARPQRKQLEKSVPHTHHQLDTHPAFVQLKTELEELRTAFNDLQQKQKASDVDSAGDTSTITEEKGELAPEPAEDTKTKILRNPITGVPYPSVVKLNSFDRKRILITGGAGFVGSHLTDVLMKQGHEVTVIDNFFTGRKKNVETWIGHPNFELVMHDVVQPFMIEVDEIYHLASPASPPHYMYNPIKTIKTNTIGTINMLGLASRTGARLLMASTSEVYGDPEVHPQVESYRGNVNPIGPRACYDEGKRIAETLCYSYQKQDGVEVRVARIFNTFGPRMHIGDGRVVSNFIIQALQNKNITVYGEGDQTRSFQYVSDLVAGLVALMNGNFSQPVNIGNPDEYTMVRFAKTIINMTDSKSQLVFKPLPKDDPMRRKPDITRAKTHLGWKPVVTVAEGLVKTIEYFKAALAEGAHATGNSHKAGPYAKIKEYEKNSQA